jgi:hypothetical protein
MPSACGNGTFARDERFPHGVQRAHERASGLDAMFIAESAQPVHVSRAARRCVTHRPVSHFRGTGEVSMGNQTQNPGQNPGQRAPGQDDKSRREGNPQNPNDPNRPQRTPGSSDDEQRRMRDQDKQGGNR